MGTELHRKISARKAMKISVFFDRASYARTPLSRRLMAKDAASRDLRSNGLVQNWTCTQINLVC